MSDQSKLGLGQIITTPQQRDAIHIAVTPIVAAHKTYPGDHVGVNPVGEADGSQKWIGVVDPFLPDGSTVKKGETFWLYLYPGSITSLRHDWTHPAFAVENHPACPEVARDPEGESRRWMEKWAMEHMSEDYHGDGEDEKLSLSTAFSNAIKAGENLHIGPYESARDHIDDEWWNHWEVLTGKKAQRGEYFSCSC